jgi:tRNA threonylcarbamoyl adenosine modification protein YeaZ
MPVQNIFVRSAAEYFKLAGHPGVNLCTPQKRFIHGKELILIINAAEGRLQFVLGWPGHNSESSSEIPPLPENPGTPEILTAEDWSAASRGTELLAPALAEALENLKLNPMTIGKIAAVTGPGSFTGLRLATVTANALACALDAESSGIEYLPLLAAGAREVFGRILPECRTIWVLTHARRGLVYVQGFRANACGQEKITPLLALGLDESIGYLAEQSAGSEGGFLLGSGIAKNLDYFTRKLSGKFHFLPRSFNHPSPDLLFKTALSLHYAKSSLSPVYARASDAEENLHHIAVKLGLDQDFAQKRLRKLLGREDL